jgi:CubicO group peptidase (beta-lactamase class C family)
MRRTAVALALLLLSACGGVPDRPLTPAEVDAGWQAAAPATVGLAPAPLERLQAAVAAMPFAHSLLVARNGCLVAEAYFNGYGKNAPQRLSSVAKGVISALVGLAIEDGLFEGPEQPLVPLLPARLQALADPAKAKITLADTMTMQSGLASTDIDVGHFDWRWSADPAALTLGQPFRAAPGTEFRYNTGNAHLISAALTERSGMATNEYAERRLFRPAGIAISDWSRDKAGLDFGGIELFMTPRNLARFAQLYADAGRIGGRQVVPAAWVERSTRPLVPPGPSMDEFSYGYFWWRVEVEGTPVVVARGWGAQTVFVLPEFKLVVVATGNFFVLQEAAARNASQVRAAIYDYLREVVPALRAAAGTPAGECALSPVR